MAESSQKNYSKNLIDEDEKAVTEILRGCLKSQNKCARQQQKEKLSLN